MSAALVVSTLLASAGLVMLLVAAMTGGVDIDSWRDRLLVTLTVVSAAAALGVVRKRRADRARLKLDPSGSSSAMVTRWVYSTWSRWEDWSGLIGRLWRWELPRSGRMGVLGALTIFAERGDAG